MMVRDACFVVLLLAFSSPVLCKVSIGRVNTDNSWVFADKFCFDERGGTFWVQASIPPGSGGQYTELLMYADAEENWPAVVNSDEGCSRRANMSNFRIPVSDLQRDYPQGRSWSVFGQRPRWWYIVFSNCVTEHVDVQYRVEFTNVGDLFQKQFGKDEQGVFEMSFVFFAVLALLLIMICVLLGILHRREMHIKMVVVLTVAVAFETLSMLLYLVHYATFARDGLGVVGAYNAGIFFDMIAQVVFMLLLLLLVRGWPLSTNFIPDKRNLIAAVVVVAASYIALFVYVLVGIRPESTLYYYDAVPGYILIAIRILVFIWAAYDLRRTWGYERDPLHKQFYVFLGVYVSLWFLLMPLLVLIAHFLQSWYRAKIITGLVFSFNTLTLIVLTYMFRPSKGNKYFAVLDPKARVMFGTNALQIFPMETLYDKSDKGIET